MSRHRRVLTQVVVGLALLALLGTTGSSAQEPVPAAPTPLSPEVLGPSRWTAPDAGIEWFFGSSVALSDRYAAIGSRWADQLRGAAYVYERLPAGSSEPPRLQLLTKLSGLDRDRDFGVSVALWGDTVAIGATHDNTAITGGQAYVFGLADPGVNVTDDVRIPKPPLAREFGAAVALTGDLLVVGGPFSDNNRGAVFVFRRPSAGWSALDPTEFTKLTAPEPQAPTRFGISVAIDGERVFVGAPGYRTGAGDGAVFIFEPPEGGWSGGSHPPDAMLTALPNAGFGWSLVLSEDLLVVTAPRWRDATNTTVGAVALISRPAFGWATSQAEPVVLLTPSDGERGAFFAASVAATTEMVVVGAPGDPPLGYEPPGAVYLYVRPRDGWQAHPGQEDLKLTPSAGAMGDRFGWAVDLLSRDLVVGAFTETGTGALRQGAAYAYSIVLPETVAIPILSSWGVLFLAAAIALGGSLLLVGRRRGGR